MNPLISTIRKLISTILSICALSIATIKNVPTLMANYYGDNVRPRVDVKLNNTTQKWLNDTGAARLCMNTTAFCKLFPGKSFKPKSRDSKLANLLFTAFAIPYKVITDLFSLLNIYFHNETCLQSVY